jgi:oligopeptidase B
MRRRDGLWLAILAVCLFAAPAGRGQGTPDAPVPPKAEVIPKRLDRFGRARVDNYYWLKDRADPKVAAYLDAENAYTDALMAPTKALQQALYDEIVGRIKQADTTAPVYDNGYYYYSRFETGKQYPILVRKKGSMEAREEVLIDENALAEGHGYFEMNGGTVSPDNSLIAYGVDTGGRLFNTIRVKDLTTGKLLEDAIPDVTPNVVWANDSRTLFYAKQDPNTLRYFQIRRHRLGSRPAADPVVYEEKDETFICYVARTRSRRYLMIASHQTLSTEYRFLDAEKPEGTFAVIQARRPRLEYSASHLGDDFYIRTNLDARNFRLMKAPVASPGLENWREVFPHRADVFLEDFALFRDFLALEERRGGLIRLRIRPWSGVGEHEVDFGEPAYRAATGPNEEVDTDKLRFIYTSMTTPMSSFDYDMKTRTKTLVKREEVLGGFVPANYVTERLHATAADGVKVPISIVYRKGFRKDGSRPLLLYGYGSYGTTMDASFDPARLSLLDRGFTYAIAHIRGGQELGRAWYGDGKLLRKKNTFTDFIACAEYLVREGYTRPDRLYAKGVSAVINIRPELFKGVVAAVPFVDAVTTMLDPSVPLTTAEYDEWGNPNERPYFDYILSYSPYDNVEARPIPISWSRPRCRIPRSSTGSRRNGSRSSAR